MSIENIDMTIKYIEREFQCKVCCSAASVINSVFPEMKSAHVSHFCSRIKKDAVNNPRICRTFDQTIATDWGRKRKKSFIKICPYGAMEIVVPFHFRQQYFGLLFAGVFQPPRLFSEDDLISSKITSDDLLAELPVLHEKRQSELVALLELVALTASVYVFDSLDMQDLQRSGPRDFILHFINKNFRSQIGLSDIADELGWSEEHTSRKIKELFGKGFSEILNEVRLANAIWLLTDSEFRIGDIARWSGFREPLYFNRVFRRSFNCTPGGYRRSAKTKSSKIKK